MSEQEYIKFACPHCGQPTKIRKAKDPFGKKKECKGCGQKFPLKQETLFSPPQEKPKSSKKPDALKKPKTKAPAKVAAKKQSNASADGKKRSRWALSTSFVVVVILYALWKTFGVAARYDEIERESRQQERQAAQKKTGYKVPVQQVELRYWQLVKNLQTAIELQQEFRHEDAIAHYQKAWKNAQALQKMATPERFAETMKFIQKTKQLSSYGDIVARILSNAPDTIQQRIETVRKQIVAPRVSGTALLTPTFYTAKENYTAGKAFCMTWPGVTHPLLISAYHLVAKAPPTELREYIKGVDLRDSFSNVDIGQINSVIVIPGVGNYGDSPAAVDIAAFWGDPDFSYTSFPLQTKEPQVADVLWLMTRSPADNEKKLYECLYIGDRQGNLLYYFKDQKFDLQATSGSPLLNAAGELVGIHVAGGEHKGKKFGEANPVKKFLPLLEKAIAMAENQPVATKKE